MDNIPLLWIGFFDEFAPKITTFLCFNKELCIFPSELLAHIVSFLIDKHTVDLDNNWDNISLLKMCYPGPMDKYLDNPAKKLKTKFHSTVSLSSDNIPIPNCSFPTSKFYFPKIDGINYVYKNLRLSSEADVVELNLSTTTEIGTNNSFESIDKSLFKTLRKLHGWDDSVAPLSFCGKEEYLMVPLNGDAILGVMHNLNCQKITASVDIYEICDDRNYNPGGVYVKIVKHIRAITSEKLQGGWFFLTGCGHTNYIIIDTFGKKLSDFTLSLNCENSLITKHNMFRYDDKYIIALSGSTGPEDVGIYGINLGVVKDVRIVLHSEEKIDDVKFYGVCLNIIQKKFT